MDKIEIEDNLNFKVHPCMKNIVLNEQIYYSTKIKKIATSRLVKKTQDRNFVLTNLAIYIIKKNEIQNRIKIQDLEAITISYNSDQFIIHGNKYQSDFLFVYRYRQKIIKILQIVFESITKKDLLFYKKPDKDLSKYVVGLKEKKNPSFEFKIENNESINEYIWGKQKNKEDSKLAPPHPQSAKSSGKSEMSLQPVRVVSGKGKGIPPPPPPPPFPHIYEAKNKISSSVNVNLPAELASKKNNSISGDCMMQMIMSKRNKMKKEGNQNQRPLGGSIKQGSSGGGDFSLKMSALQVRMSGSGGGSNRSGSNSNKISSEPLKSNVELFKDNSNQESNIDNNNKIIEEDESDDSDEEKDLCCICMENKSESVFVPCGHRCVCFVCGDNIIKSKNKKCPICQEESTALLKKVYDS